MKYVVVAGGVISGVGKGIIASSTGLLLKTLGLKITIKIDPYLNVDAGTMRPKEHGEVFVLSDGGEVDLDLGNYERFLNLTLTRDNNITTGKIYQHVIERERRGDYQGITVQVVPHITDAISDWMERVARIPVDNSGEEPDVCIIELGGTVGDIEGMPFIEAINKLKKNAGEDNFMLILVTYVMCIHDEHKTKPTQRAMEEARSKGLIPTLVAARSSLQLERDVVEKIANSCHITTEQVLAVKDMPSIYQVPMLLEKQNLVSMLRKSLALDKITISPENQKVGQDTWAFWQSITAQDSSSYDTVSIALVGKYVGHHPDAYHSVMKALEHSAMACRRKLVINWIKAEDLEPEVQHSDAGRFHTAWKNLAAASGILVPGGFGQRGIEGLIAAAEFARVHKKPYLGICLGMQTAVIEYARNVCGIKGAVSEEFDENAADKVIMFMPEVDRTTLGATMRLGLRPTHCQPDTEWSRLRKLYDAKDQILERHRHRYEVNPTYVDILEKAGLSFVGKDEAGMRMEIIEIKDHPWFVAVQFHPEYLSRVLNPSRSYMGFIAASAGILDQVTKDYEQGTNSRLATEGITNGFGGLKMNGATAF